MKNIVPLILVITFLFGCKNTDDKLLIVSPKYSKSSNGSDNYSMNIKKNNFKVTDIEQDSIIQIVKKSKSNNLHKVNYEFATGVLNDHLKIYSLLYVKSGNDHGVQLVVFNKMGELTSLFDLASWNGETKIVCKGEVDNNLIISKGCGSEEEIEKFKITNDGQIIQL